MKQPSIHCIHINFFFKSHILIKLLKYTFCKLGILKDNFNLDILRTLSLKSLF